MVYIYISIHTLHPDISTNRGLVPRFNDTQERVDAWSVNRCRCTWTKC